jgi:ABC-type transporter Mla MlaB component
MEKKILELEDIVSNYEIATCSDDIEIKLDLSGVTKVDMCALALILEIERKIKVLSKGKIFFNLLWLNVPSDLVSLADLCGLTQDLEFK